MLTTLHITFRTLVWSLIGLGLVLVLVILRLAAGPVQLDWLQPRIEEALTPEGAAVAATIGRAELRLNKDARTLELVGVDVRYRSEKGGEGPEDEASPPFLVFPEVGVTLSVEALLKRGVIAASEVTAEAPSLAITRSQDGIIGLHSEADDEGHFQDVDAGAFFRRFALPAERSGRLGFLKRLRISGAEVSFYDERDASVLTAEQADLSLTRRAGGVDGWLRAKVAQPGHTPASLHLSGGMEEGVEQIVFEADIAELMLAGLPTLWPSGTLTLPPALAGFRLPVKAAIDGEIGVDGLVSPLKVKIDAADGAVDLPDVFAEPLEIDRAVLDGIVDSDLGSMAIDEIRIVSRGAMFGGAGSVAWREGKPTLALDLNAKDVRAEDVAAFWPMHAAPTTRRWVQQNIETGFVREADVRLDFQPGEWGQRPLRQDAITGRLALEGLSVRYMREMPPIEEAVATATFDARRIDFDVTEGVNQGVRLGGGSVTISNIGRREIGPAELHVLVDAEGSVEQALTVLDHPPLNIARNLTIAPSTTTGSVTTSIDVRMPLFRGVKGDAAVVRAEADLTDLGIERLPTRGGDFRLDGGAFRLLVEDKTVRLGGEARVNGVPLRIDVFEPRKDDEEEKRRIDLGGLVSLDQLENQGIVIDALDGAVGFEATITETGDRLWIDLEADLAGLAITPPGLVWQKQKDAAGLLRASIVKPADGPLEVKQFHIDAAGLKASGQVELSPATSGLKALILDQFRLGETDAAIRVSPDGEGGYEVVIEAERLDIDDLFGVDRELGGAFQRFHTILRADRLRVRGIELTDVEADAVHRRDGWRSASMIGALPSGGKLALELAAEGAGQRLELRAEAAGALITALDLGQRIEGGSLALSAYIASQGPMIADGRFEIDNFTLKDAPQLARLLTLASFSGIENLLDGEGIKVDHLILPFALVNRRLTITDGLMRGSQIGLTLKGDIELETKNLDLVGTIIPVYSLNRLIGQVPVLGRILTGVDGRGAFAATYSIEGPSVSPTVYVNPLSILTPGLLRDLFGGLINGTLEPPPPNDD